MRTDQRIYPNVPQRGTIDGIQGPTDPATDNTGGWLAKIAATLNIGFSTVADEVRCMRRDMAKATQAPVFGKVTDNVIVAANGIGIVRLTGPDQGHFWYIRKIMVSGLTPPTVAAGRADIYVSAADMRSQTSLASIGVQDWRDQATSLPLVASYGAGELILRMNEELYVVFSGATPAQVLVASATYVDYEEGFDATNWNI